MKARGRLFRKYVVIIVALVSGALLASGAIEIYFSYQENKAALVAVQREKAIAAAFRIEAFIKEIEHQIGWTTQPQLVAPSAALDQRRFDFLRLLRQVPAITEISYLDGAGKEQLRVSRLAMDVVGSQIDFSAGPRFREAKGGRTYYGPVDFRKESEPYMTIAMAGSGPRAGVTVVEVNLKFIWEVVSQIKVGKAGQAYAVDGRGSLIAHPDISLVLQKTAFSGLPQVQAATAGRPRPGNQSDELAIARDFKNRRILTAYATIAPLRWSVFVEQPLEEAFEPLRASIQRTGLLLLLGVGLSFLASLVLARRMVRPIGALQVGAAKIGAGDLGERIDVRTGDELEALADQFNSMAAQLKESYAGLERKVEERTTELDQRTRDLAQSLEEVGALSEVSRAVSSSLDLRRVLDTVATYAVSLSGCDASGVFEFNRSRQSYDVVASRNLREPFLEELQATVIDLQRSIIRRAAESGQPVQIPNLETAERMQLRDTTLREGFQALLAVPMGGEDDTRGLVIFRRTPGAFDDRVLNVVTALANQSKVAIENAHLFLEIEEKGRELEVANRHKSEFLANMSHELRTPLNAIIGFSEVLLERMFGEVNEKQAEYLEDIFTSGKHLLSLINDILDLSKVEAGRMELEVTTFSLPMAIDNALTLVRSRAENHGITLDVTLDERLGDFAGDERKFKQILLNLLSNAVKFTPEGGRVSVKAAVADGSVEIAVTDTGIGIPPEDQEAIFEEFRQASTEHAGKREGTGLGLTLTRKFVELHGGTIGVKSQVGHGSTFTFTLPIKR